MEHNTDRLFWTLTSIIIGALLLTISVKAFPSVASTITAPLQGVIQQGDSSTKTADQAFKDATNSNDSSSSSNSSQSSQPTDPDTEAKTNAVEVRTLNLNVAPNNDGTGMLAGPIDGTLSGSLNIPKYVKVNGRLIKITSIGSSAFYGNSLTSVSIPNSVTSIGDSAFSNNQLTSITIPNSVSTIGVFGFTSNKLDSVNIPNQQAYQSTKINLTFDPSTTITNNPSN